MALDALISLSFQPEAPAGGVVWESNNLNLFKDIRPAAIQPFPLPSCRRRSHRREYPLDGGEGLDFIAFSRKLPAPWPRLPSDNALIRLDKSAASHIRFYLAVRYQGALPASIPARLHSAPFNVPDSVLRCGQLMSIGLGCAMPNTLGLDDDLDGVEVVRDLERIFDIKVSNEEAERIFTVGEFHDLLLSKFPPNEADKKCATAMTFYRIRRALRRLGYGDRVTPGFDMRLLERGRTKSNLMRLEAESGLRMPGTVSTRTGRLVALFGFVMILVIVFSFQPGFASAFLGVIVGLVVVGAILKYGDPGKLPANCNTLADLTRTAAAMNYGRLVKMGARHRDEDIWDNLVEALSHYALPEPDITRETFFLQSQLKKHSAV